MRCAVLCCDVLCCVLLYFSVLCCCVLYWFVGGHADEEAEVKENKLQGGYCTVRYCTAFYDDVKQGFTPMIINALHSAVTVMRVSMTNRILGKR
jgi:hypothetical protein